MKDDMPYEAERKTVLATQAIANVVKSSFGPSGLDKMMVDDIGVGALSSEAFALCAEND